MKENINQTRQENKTLHEMLNVIEDNIDSQVFDELTQYFYTDDEQEVSGLLAEAYNKFRRLEVMHSHDIPEFTKAIHDAMNIVMARVVLRQTGIAGER